MKDSLKEKVPNFFIIGAPKCGTTALSEYLKVHPNIFLCSPKEPNFFSKDLSKISKMSLNTYLSLFSKVDLNKHVAIGEASISYLRSNKAVSEILKFNPASKMIVMLRNPVDLVQSWHSQLLYLGVENIPNFEDAWNAEIDRKGGKRIPLLCFEKKGLLYSEWGKLGSQIERLFLTTGFKNVKIIIFDDFIKNTKAVYEEVLSFLNVDFDGRIDFPRINENKIVKRLWLQPLLALPVKIPTATRALFGFPKDIEKYMALPSLNTTPGSRPKISDEFRSELNSFFREDVLKLSKILKRDLSHWVSHT